jgi:hypothetical protein
MNHFTLIAVTKGYQGLIFTVNFCPITMARFFCIGMVGTVVAVLAHYGTVGIADAMLCWINFVSTRLGDIDTRISTIAIFFDIMITVTDYVVSLALAMSASANFQQSADSLTEKDYTQRNTRNATNTKD